MKRYLEKKFNLFTGLKAHKWKVNNMIKDEMYETGINIFSGSQGSGKTLSLVHYLKPILKDFPKAIVVTNMELKFDIKNEVREYTGFHDFQIENDIYGVIYILDEIHLILNSLESKGIPLSVIVELSQQRKQRKLILGTSQVYSRMAKPLREQVKNVLVCKNYFGLLQFNYLIDAFNTTEKSDGKLKVDKLKRAWFFHSIADYVAYDTYKKMDNYIGVKSNGTNYN